MRTIEAFVCPDGKIFANENEAKNHEDDLLGQELDGLLKLFEFGGRLTRSDECRAVLSMMKKRQELKQQISLISEILNHSEE